MAGARVLLTASVVLVTVMLLAACEPEEAAVDQPEAPAEAVTPDGPQVDAPEVTAGEAPTLAELVDRGELPPVHERLPANPLVVEPVERVGDYGGQWRTALLGPADTAWLDRTVAYDQLMRWNPEFTDVVPNLVESVEVNDEATAFILTLREGVRWSDGEPFTVDDIVFWYEDYLLNEELAGQPPSWMVTGGEVATLEADGDHRVTFTFAEPNGMFLMQLAMPGAANRAGAASPRHYLEQFHADHNPDIDALVAEAGLADWPELFELRSGSGSSGMAVDLPTLKPWVMLVDLGEGPQITFERNPYYWKVDTDGNQLPYLDRVVFDVVEDSEVLVFKALNGELDMHSRHITDLANRAVLADHRDSGDYRFFDISATTMNVGIIALNLTHKDPVLREVFQSLDFRIGLSHAIDRQEIIDVVYVGQGEPWQAAPRPESEFYNERLATQYTEYDVDLANEHLDRAGYAERDADGYRLGPAGQRISFDVDVAAEQTARIDALELIGAHWSRVGVEMRINSMDRSLFTVRLADNDHDAMIWGGDGGAGLHVVLDPFWYFPSLSAGAGSGYAKLWALWFEGEPDGEEPPEPTRRQMELYRQLEGTSDPDEQAALMAEIIDIAVDEFYAIGIALDPDGYGLVRNDFRNVPERMPGGWRYPDPAPTNPEQYFVEQ